jgi:predicted acylesterase/phospholipase RssA/CRP-like cAMP-binding protein
VLEIAEVGAGEVVGEIAALLGGSRTAEVKAAERSEVAIVAAAGTAILAEAAPGVVEHLFETATRRLRETQLAAAIARLFGSELDQGRHHLVDSIEWITLRAGERLFTKGDVADAAYVLVSGRLRELDESPTGSSGLVISEIAAGELVGETTLLRSTPRTVTVAATRDSTLARLPHDVFDRLAAEQPQAMLAVMRGALDRILEPHVRRRPSALTIAVFGIDAAVDARAVTQQLARELRAHDNTVHLWSDRVDDHLGKAGIANSVIGSPGELRVRYWLEDAEQDHEIVILEADPAWTPWTRRALGQADRIVLLADAAATDVSIRPMEAAVYERFRTSATPPHTTLVLLHPDRADDPRSSVRWLEDRPVTDHLHVRRTSDSHMGRLARLVSGRALSLVLSGGGARGFAHLGVVRAMRELGIPVDMVAASSIGAPLAYYVAMEVPTDEMIERAAAGFASLKDYTVPVVAMLRGRAITRQIEESMEGHDFEDCWVPFFCVATSLSESEDVVLRHGPLAPAVRASVSIPGVLPPVAMDGRVLIDGASINNLPVDHMRNANPTGTIIAVDVSHAEAIPAGGDFPAQVSGWSVLMSRLTRHRRPTDVPRIGATLVASSLVGANHRKHRQLREEVADLYLALDVRDVGLLDFSAGNVRHGAMVGYVASFDQLQAWRDQHLGAAFLGE